MKNLREITGNPTYWQINREERNVAAILYHLLIQGDNLLRFLALLNYPKKDIINDELAVYYEYAFIRDLWNSIDKSDNEEKRNFISQYLELEGISLPQNNLGFNRFFGASRAMSSNFIASPANWSIEAMDDKIKKDAELFKKVCFFKWSFNAKPDIVIHTSKSSAICIEAKWDSNEGKYSAGESLKNVHQMEIQKEVMTSLLELNTTFCYLVKKKPRKEVNAQVITWAEAFEVLDNNGSLPFILKWIDRIKEESKN